MATDFASKCVILSELWLDYRDDESFTDFVAYNDLGLPAAYMLANGILPIEDDEDASEESYPVLTQFINEAFRLLLDGLGIKEDTGYFFLEDVLEDAQDD